MTRAEEEPPNDQVSRRGLDRNPSWPIKKQLAMWCFMQDLSGVRVLMLFFGGQESPQIKTSGA